LTLIDGGAHENDGGANRKHHAFNLDLRPFKRSSSFFFLPETHSVRIIARGYNTQFWDRVSLRNNEGKQETGGPPMLTIERKTFLNIALIGASALAILLSSQTAQAQIDVSHLRIPEGMDIAVGPPSILANAGDIDVWVKLSDPPLVAAAGENAKKAGR
jgi:hypothetical protein